jgi:hypothetical protein
MNETGSYEVSNIERFENKKSKMNLRLKNEKGKESGEINIEIEWEASEEERQESKKEEKQEAPQLRREEWKKEGKQEAPQLRREESKKEVKSEKEGVRKESLNNTLKVRVIDAKFYEKQDVFGQGDPYVTVTFNNRKFKTKVYNNTRSAIYNEGM